MATPTHKLVLTSKTNKHRRTYAGVAWETPEGWLSIQLNPGVVIAADRDYYISIYPIGEKSHNATEPPPFTDEDIPF